VCLELFEGEGIAVPALPGGGDGPAVPGVVRHLAFQVDDVDGFLAAAGGELAVSLGPLDFGEVIPGWRTVWVTDPDGVVVEVSQGYRDEAPSEDEVRGLVLDWFERISRRVPVEEVLPMVAGEALLMEFPEATLTCESDFRRWYAEVGATYHEQAHEVRQLEVRPGAAAVELDVQVVWTARQRADGSRLAYLARQSWRIVRDPATGGAVIASYRVHSLDELDGVDG
jgi:hypothetical protein